MNEGLDSYHLPRCWTGRSGVRYHGRPLECLRGPDAPIIVSAVS